MLWRRIIQLLVAVLSFTDVSAAPLISSEPYKPLGKHRKPFSVDLAFVMGPRSDGRLSPFTPTDMERAELLRFLHLLSIRFEKVRFGAFACGGVNSNAKIVQVVHTPFTQDPVEIYNAFQTASQRVSEAFHSRNPSRCVDYATRLMNWRYEDVNYEYERIVRIIIYLGNSLGTLETEPWVPSREFPLTTNRIRFSINALLEHDQPIMPTSSTGLTTIYMHQHPAYDIRIRETSFRDPIKVQLEIYESVLSSINERIESNSYNTVPQTCMGFNGCQEVLYRTAAIKVKKITMSPFGHFDKPVDRSISMNPSDRLYSPSGKLNPKYKHLRNTPVDKSIPAIDTSNQKKSVSGSNEHAPSDGHRSSISSTDSSDSILKDRAPFQKSNETRTSSNSSDTTIASANQLTSDINQEDIITERDIHDLDETLTPNIENDSLPSTKGTDEESVGFTVTSSRPSETATSFFSDSESKSRFPTAAVIAGAGGGLAAVAAIAGLVTYYVQKRNIPKKKELAWDVCFENHPVVNATHMDKEQVVECALVGSV